MPVSVSSCVRPEDRCVLSVVVSGHLICDAVHAHGLGGLICG